jgi:hypothetical protein
MTKTVLAEQIAEVEREIAMRARVYPGLIAAGKLSQALADRQTACLAGALKTLQWLRDHETQIKDMLRKKTP